MWSDATARKGWERVIERRSRLTEPRRLPRPYPVLETSIHVCRCRESAGLEALVPPAIGHVGIGFMPMLQFEKINLRNPLFKVSFDEMIESALRRRQLDLGHERYVVNSYRKTGLESPLHIGVLLMGN